MPNLKRPAKVRTGRIGLWVLHVHYHEVAQRDNACGKAAWEMMLLVH